MGNFTTTNLEFNMKILNEVFDFNYKYMLFLSLLSCNMSDYNEEITNGYQYNFESSDKCLNSIINSEKRIEDFGVFDIKYNDIYISYYVLDSSFCANRQYDENLFFFLTIFLCWLFLSFFTTKFPHTSL